MSSFWTDEESRASQLIEKYTYPDEIAIGVLLDKTGWDYFTFRATPPHIIQQMQMKWHLDNVIQDAQERKAKKKK